MGKALYMHSVQDAAAIAGGPERLAEVLGVSAADVARWSCGAAIPECAVFLRVIDIVLHPERHFPSAAERAARAPADGLTGSTMAPPAPT
jgi:hypothetical protein